MVKHKLADIKTEEKETYLNNNQSFVVEEITNNEYQKNLPFGFYRFFFILHNYNHSFFCEFWGGKISSLFR
jgi:hypothetical protein